VRIDDDLLYRLSRKIWLITGYTLNREHFDRDTREGCLYTLTQGPYFSFLVACAM
jgi:hypothetical protein